MYMSREYIRVSTHTRQSRAKGESMLRSRAKAALLGVLALLLASSFAAATAHAAAGPFAYHRAIGEKGNGVKISEKSPEPFQGEGGEQRQKAKLAGTEVEGIAESVQAKGIIYNNNLQGQLKVELKFHGVRATKPNLPECKITIGTNDAVKVVGHLAWKWNGTEKQLAEQPQSTQGPTGVGLATEISQGATEIPEPELLAITYAGSGCGVLIGKYIVKGSETINTKPSKLGEWSKSLSITLSEEKELIHFWNGKTSIGGETHQMLGGEVAKISGESKAEVPSQEITVFEN
jgi:hypothetical protein